VKRTILRAALVGSALLSLCGSGYAAAAGTASHTPSHASTKPPITTPHPKKHHKPKKPKTVKGKTAKGGKTGTPAPVGANFGGKTKKPKTTVKHKTTKPKSTVKHKTKTKVKTHHTPVHKTK
jgi:hypothetical protein